MSIFVLKPGLLTTVQDLGRYGWQRHGVIVSGAMDPFALRLANLLVGNDEGEAALEMTWIGPELKFETDSLIAVTGGNLNPSVNGQPVPIWRPVLVKSGSVLRFTAAINGCRGYLAAAGGFRIASVLGSKSTYLRAGIGGFEGRALRETDRLPLGTPAPAVQSQIRQLQTFPDNSPFASVNWRVSEHSLSFYREKKTIRVMRGGEFLHFNEASRSRFFHEEFRVTPQSDRMGYRLSDVTLELQKPLEMISEAVTAGTIQVPPDGNPIVLTADRQTTGGYPKIAQIISADLPILAQIKPGEKLRFREVSLEEAQELYRSREQELHILRQGLRLNWQQGLRQA
jgi:antagonist of KipI